MTYEEMVASQQKVRRKPSNIESRIQQISVKWFRMQYPELAHALFSVPNGGKRDAIIGHILKEEGALAGVSDMLLLKTNRFYGALLIEFKTPKGKQSEAQKDWEQKITKDNYKYIVVRSLDQFIEEIRKYLADV